MFRREGLLFGTQGFGPTIRYFRQVRIGFRAERFHDFREWITEIFVIAFAKAVAFHDDVAAERLFLGKNFGEFNTFFKTQEIAGKTITIVRELGSNLIPLNCCYEFSNVPIHLPANLVRFAEEFYPESILKRDPPSLI